MSTRIRCSILGNAAGGKSTLTRALSSKVAVDAYELDEFLWKGNWESVSFAEFEVRHDAILEREQWIIDGFGNLETTKRRIARSTHVVLVDLPIWLHFSMAAERQASWKQGELTNPPGGMKMAPPTKRLFELMWTIHTDLMPTVRNMVAEAKQANVRVEIVSSLARLRELQFNPSSLLE